MSLKYSRAESHESYECMLVEAFTYSPSQVANFTHGIELQKVIYQPVLGLKEAFFWGEVPYKSSFLSMSMCRYNSPRFILCGYHHPSHGIDFVDDRKLNNKTWRNPRFYGGRWVPTIQRASNILQLKNETFRTEEKSSFVQPLVVFPPYHQKNPRCPKLPKVLKHPSHQKVLQITLQPRTHLIEEFAAQCLCPTAAFIFGRLLKKTQVATWQPC